MKLNSITCIGYQRVPDGFAAVLLNTTKEAILAINPTIITITADDDKTVETFVGFRQVTKITENLTHDQFEVFFPLDDGTHTRLMTLEEENAALRAQLSQTSESLSAAQAAIDFLLLS